MTAFVHDMHSGGQAAFTWGAVDSDAAAVHAPNMRKNHGSNPRKIPDNFVKAWREYRGLTLEQLADQVDMSHASIQRIETGSQNYTINTLQKIAVALGTDVATLLHHGPENDVAAWPTWTTATAAERRQIEEMARTIVGWRRAS